LGARGVARVRRALARAQVMVSAALLIPTGLFLKSLLNLMRVDGVDRRRARAGDNGRPSRASKVSPTQALR
jgi:hypothetical protein